MMRPLIRFLLLGAALHLLAAGWSHALTPRPAGWSHASTPRPAGPENRPAPSPSDPSIPGYEHSDETLLYQAGLEAGLDRDDPTIRRRLVEDMRFLIDDPARDDDALYQEALELGLARTDPVIRRRVIQQMRLRILGEAPPLEPSEEELEAFLRRLPDRFARPPRVTLTQVFLSRDRRGAALEADAHRMLRTLRSGRVSPSAGPLYGDPSLLEPRLPAKSEADLAGRFGPDFARVVVGLEAGGWRGPVASSYGLHLVWVEAREPGRPAALAEVRERVRAGLVAELEQRTIDAALRDLRAGSTAVKAAPEGDEVGAGAAAGAGAAVGAGAAAGAGAEGGKDDR